MRDLSQTQLRDEKERKCAMSTEDTRFVGIRHRVKETAIGEARPTQIAILVAGVKPRLIELKTERHELDFVLGCLPVSWRVARKDEDFSQFLEHHIVQRKKHGSKTTDEKETIVPNSYEGFRTGDTIAMILGGSGDFFAFALSRKADEIDAQVLRIPSFVLKQKRSWGHDKNEDAILLAELIRDEPELFWPVTLRDRELILVRKRKSERVDAMKARIACEQRLRQRVIGAIFCNEDGLDPEESPENTFEVVKLLDTAFGALVTEEKARKKELSEALEKLDIYRRLFKPINGCGPAIASRIISAIIDIRRFETAAKLKAFCGVHVLPDGKFARRRRGQVSNWHPDARQALFLLGDQFNRRPDSIWSKKLRKHKAKFRETHPHPVMAKSTIVGIFREVERFFLSSGVILETENLKINNMDDLYEFLQLGIHELSEEIRDEKSGRIKELQEKIDNASVSGNSSKIYTASHIHKMALWRTLTKFVEWLFREWWRLEREVAAQPAQGKKAA